jgi:hypothetical protein
LGHETANLLVGAKEFFYAFAQRGIRAASFVEKARALGRILSFERRVK